MKTLSWSSKVVDLAPAMHLVLDECDTAFAVINVCDNLTPQARGCLGKTWTMVQEVLGKVAGPGSSHAEAAKENMNALNNHYFHALNEIAELMSGQEWDSDTTCEIAEIVRNAGFEIKEA